MPRGSLYLHIPYCQAKCPYCDFNSFAAARWPEAEYADALVRELEHYAAQPEWRVAIDTLFFGGGTPSLFAPDTIARVLEAAQRLWPQRSSQSPVGSRQKEPEVTLEANPGTVTRDTLRGFRAAGINRISFGVQSFTPRHLQTLGRIHDEKAAIAAIELARAAGFTNVNLDLIFAVPGQTPAEWDADLRTAIALAPDHLSVYNLTFEPGTAFHALRAKGELRQSPEEIEVAMFTRAQEVLGTAGYVQYEISNYARPGYECRHNLTYWRGGAYIGVGAGAHGYSSYPDAGRRWSNEKNPNVYIARVNQHGHARASEETLTSAQARGEFVFLNLRLREGFAARRFTDRFGVEFLEAFPHAQSLRRDGLLTTDGARWRLTDRGLMVADSVFATFL